MNIPGVATSATSLVALLFAGAFAASAVLTWLARAYALHRQLIDHPGARRSHASPTPRGGGIGPVAVLVVAGGWLGLHDAALATCTAAVACVATVGWIDDHRPLPAWIRLVVHLAAGVAVAFALLGVPHDAADVAWCAVAALWVAGLVNAWNFMDGIDGIAASQAALVAVLLVAAGALGSPWIDGAWSAFALVLAGAAFGFLPFNMPRARIFLGDVGSGALGCVVACLLLRAVAQGRVALPVAVLPVSAFLVDAGMTLASRVVNGKRWWRPHREHLYQWLVRSGHPHARVTGWYAGWTVAAAALALVLARCTPVVAAWVSGAAILCACLSWTRVRNRLWMVARQRR